MVNVLRSLAHEHQDAAGVEVEFDCSRLPLGLLREMLERLERLLETGRRLPMGRALRRLPSGLVEEDHRLLPRLAPERVISQTLHVLREPLGVEAFDGFDDPGMEGAPALLQETAVGDLMGERVFEGVLQVREETGLIQELRGLQAAESNAQLFLGRLGNRLEQRTPGCPSPPPTPFGALPCPRAAA